MNNGAGLLPPAWTDEVLPLETWLETWLETRLETWMEETEISAEKHRYEQS